MYSGNPWVIVSITWHCEDSVSSALPAYLTKQDAWKALILFVYCQFVGGKGPIALLASATPRAHHHVYFKIMLLWYQYFKCYNYPFIGQNKVVITHSILRASPFLCQWPRSRLLALHSAERKHDPKTGWMCKARTTETVTGRPKAQGHTWEKTSSPGKRRMILL